MQFHRFLLHVKSDERLLVEIRVETYSPFHPLKLVIGISIAEVGSKLLRK